MEDDLQDLFDNAPCGYVSTRPDGRITKINHTLSLWLHADQDQLLGKRFQDLLNIAGKIYYETHFAPLLRMQGFFNEVALDLVGNTGQPVPVLVNAVERRDESGQVRFIRITVFNATDRRRYERELLEAQRTAETAGQQLRELNRTLAARVHEAVNERMQVEEALRQSQKMEAIGQLTGGLAHDFNNLLTGILGNLDLLEMRLGQGRVADLERYIIAARGIAQRASTLTHRLLAFARRQTLDPKPTDINRLVAGMEELIRRTMGELYQIEVVRAAGLWAAYIDQNQLENALLNLCINARDAMLNGGRLTIETANRWLDEHVARRRDLPAGQYVSLSVTDTGTGMPPEVAERIFDPFFTTKAAGKGTGLGLSMIHGFMRQSGGEIRVYSEVGRGTTVCLYLPRHYGEAEELGPTVEQRVAESPGSGETILVVDDEPSVRTLVVEVLEELGYLAIEAGDGPTALRLLQSVSSVDLLITDLTLPGGINGREVADRARTLRPSIRVLFITGYAENSVISNGQLQPGVQLLHKPFSMQVLASRVKNILLMR
jgi:signal transduction histidine kinase